MPVRVNQHRRNIKALYRSYIDAIHIKKAFKKKLKTENSRVGTNSEFFTTFDETDCTTADVKEKEARLRNLAKDPNIYQKLVNSLGD